MKQVRYSPAAAKDLKRYGNVAARIVRVLAEYAADPGAHANNITQLVGSEFFRLPENPAARAGLRLKETAMAVQTIVSPSGDELVVLSRQEYQDMLDVRDAARVSREIAAGAPTLSEAEVEDYLAAPTPLAFWRRHRGQTQAVLADAAGISQPYLAQIETGTRVGDVALYARLARLLGVRMEDLVVEDAP